MDFALGQFDVMTRLGEEVREIQETAKWRAKHAEVISSIKRFEDTRLDYYENEMMTDPDEEEEREITQWINEDFITFLKEQLYCYCDLTKARDVFIQRAVAAHTFNDDASVEIGVWRRAVYDEE